MVRTRLHVLNLFYQARLTTSGVTGATGVYAYVDIDVPGISDLVLRAEDITLIVMHDGTSGSNNFEYNVEMIGGYNRQYEALPVALGGADITANSPFVDRRTPITTTDDFLPHTRIRIRFKNKDGVSGVQTALVSAMLLIKVASA